MYMYFVIGENGKVGRKNQEMGGAPLLEIATGERTWRQHTWPAALGYGIFPALGMCAI